MDNFNPDSEINDYKQYNAEIIRKINAFNAYVYSSKVNLSHEEFMTLYNLVYELRDTYNLYFQLSTVERCARICRELFENLKGVRERLGYTIELDKYYEELTASIRLVRYFGASEPYIDTIETLYTGFVKELKAWRILNLNPIVHDQNLKMRPGYVYFLQDIDVSQTIKIGRTRDIDDRLSAFAVKLPFRTELLHKIKCRNCVVVEQHLHKYFESKRKMGEWFSLSKDDMEVVKRVREL